jgi:hypothetical protein
MTAIESGGLLYVTHLKTLQEGKTKDKQSHSEHHNQDGEKPTMAISHNSFYQELKHL